MDPSYKNSNSGDGSGGMNPNGAMQPVAPAGPVVSEQPITPVQPVAPVQPVMPGQLPSALEQPVVSEQSVMPVQSVSPMQPAQRINPITHRPMGSVAGGAAMNQMSGQMTSPMMGDAVPNQNMMQPMSSGASGDIVLAGAEKKKPKLSTIIIVAFAVLFALVVLVLAITRTIGGGPDKVSGSGDVKKAFNSYVNYVMWGKESDEDFEIDDVYNVVGYYRNISNSDMLEQYLKKTYELYNGFEDLYFENENDDMVANLDSVNVYYYDYVSMLPLDIADIRAQYESGGKNAAVNFINNHYSHDNGLSMLLDDYVKLEKELSDTYVSVVGTLNNNGCMVVDVLDDGCYVLAKNDYDQIIEKMYESMNVQNSLFYNAIDVLLYVYDNIYGIGSQSNV